MEEMTTDIKEKEKIQQVKKIKIKYDKEAVYKYLENLKILKSSSLYVLLPSFIYPTKTVIYVEYNKLNLSPISNIEFMGNLKAYVKDISLNLNGIHEYSLVHGNIKPNNVLIESRTNKLYLNDCFENEIRDYRSMTIEKLKYLSPEQLYSKETSRFSDYWSFCFLLFHLINEGNDLITPTDYVELVNEIEKFISCDDKKHYLYSRLLIKTDEKKDYIEMINNILCKKLTFKEISEYISKPKDKLFSCNSLRYSIYNNLIIAKHLYISITDKKLYKEVFNEYLRTYKSNFFFSIMNFIWFNETDCRTNEYMNKLPPSLPVIDYNDYDKDNNERNKQNTLYLGIDFIKRIRRGFQLDLSDLNSDRLFLFFIRNLRYLSYLSYINLSWNNFKVPRLIDFLKENFDYFDQLKELICSDNRIGDKGVKFLSKHMEKMIEVDSNNRKSMNFSDSNMTINGLKWICRNFEVISCINELFLDNNDLKKEGLQYFEEHCGGLTSLVYLNLEYNGLENNCSDTIIGILRKLSKLECLSLKGNFIKADSIEKLKSISNKVNITC